jgi:hypothetical protein
MPAGCGFAILDHEVKALDPGFLFFLFLFCLGGCYFLFDEEGGRVSFLYTVVDPEETLTRDLER